MRWLSRLAVAIAIPLAWPGLAGGHVAPAERENNRYLKITPLGDRLRLSYTLYFGEVPGLSARARMDENRDRVIDEREADRFGAELAAEVAGALELSVDGQRAPIRWDDVHVGLGSRAVSAGSFAVDLLAWRCLEEPEERREHSLALYDRFHIPEPGETELRIEEGPGIRVTRSALGAKSDALLLHFRWFGGPGPAAKLGYYLDFRVDPDEAMFPTTPCRETPEPKATPEPSSPSLRARILGTATLTLLFALAILWVRRIT